MQKHYHVSQRRRTPENPHIRPNPCGTACLLAVSGVAPVRIFVTAISKKRSTVRNLPRRLEFGTDFVASDPLSQGIGQRGLVLAIRQE